MKNYIEHDLKISVDTKLDYNNQIIQSDIHMPFSEKAFSRQVIDVQNQQVREALIKLGWTPPKEGNNHGT